MKKPVVRGLVYSVLCCSALAHAQLPGPASETPLRKDPVIIPNVGNVGFLSAEGEQVQYTLRQWDPFGEPMRTVRLSAANGEVLGSKRGSVRNADGFSFVSALTLNTRTCFLSCSYLGSEIQAFDAEDRPLWRVYDRRPSPAALSADGLGPTLLGNSVARSATSGARLVADHNCSTHAAWRDANLLSCLDAPSQLRFTSLQGDVVWRLDGVVPASVVLSPDSRRSAVLTLDGRVRVLDTASGRTQLLSAPLGSLLQLLWANEEQLYVRTESDLFALSASAGQLALLWRRSFAELGVTPGWTGTDELGRIYLTSLSPNTDVWQLSLDGNSARTALSYRAYIRPQGNVVHRFGRTLVEALASGELRGIDRDSGMERWRAPSITAPQPQATAASVVGDAVYVASVLSTSESTSELRLDQYDAGGLAVRTDTPFPEIAPTGGYNPPTLLAPAAAGSKIIVGAVQGSGSSARLTLAGYQHGRRLWQTTHIGLCGNNEPLLIQASQDYLVVGMHPLNGRPYLHCQAEIFDADTGARVRSSPLIALLPGTNNALRVQPYPAASDIVDVRTGALVAPLANGLRALHLDAVGKRIVAVPQDVNGEFVSLNFDGRRLASVSLPAGASARDSFALDGLLLINLYDPASPSPYTAAFDLTTSLQRWRSTAVPPFVKWLRSGDRWRHTSVALIRQAGQRVSSVELAPLTGEVGYRHIGFTSAHSERTADLLVGELPGRIVLHSGGRQREHGLLTGWTVPLNPSWMRDARVDLSARELGQSLAGDGRLRARLQLANPGPDTAQDALLSVATLDDFYAPLVSACSASGGAVCPPLDVAAPQTLDLPAGAYMQIELMFPGIAASDLFAVREPLRVSLMPRLQDLDADLTDNEYLQFLDMQSDAIFRDAFEN